MLYDLGSHSVETSGDAYFVAPSAAVIGRVKLGRDANIWFGAVLRGDTNQIEIGDGTNVQDNSVLHVDDDAPCSVGSWVTIGHSATVHGCTIGDYCLIGIGATVLSHSEIGRYSIIGAGALVTEHKAFPERSLILGVPAKRVREVTDEEIAAIQENAEHYVQLGWRYRAELRSGPGHERPA